MRLTSLVVACALALAGALPLAEAWADSPGVRSDPNFPPLSSQGALPAPGWGMDRPAQRNYGRSYRQPRPQIYCDAYNRCFQRYPGGSRSWGLGVRPPGWADDLPRRARERDRFLRPRSEVVCDRATSICYKRGRVDKSETRALFGDRAADRADDLRDRRGTGRLFVPERGVSCDTARQVCYDEGSPDFSLTRRYFGLDAAGRLN